MLKPSSCSKLSPRKSYKNAFGLPAITTCPGRTNACESVCYTKKITDMYSGVLPALEANLAHVDRILDGYGVEALMTDLFDMVLNAKVSEFRIHWCGDFHRVDYAQAWRDVCLAMPHIKFWCYTRSFDFVPLFKDVPNLRLHLSLDADNWKAGWWCWDDNPWVHISTMGVPFGKFWMPQFFEHWGFDCPAIAPGPLHGSEAPCLKCRVCIDSKSRNIVNFPIHR